MSEESKSEPVEEQVAHVGQVVTQTAPAIIVNGEALTDQEAIAYLINKVDKIEKAVA